MSTYIPLFPPLLAIVLAISTRKAYVAIFSGIVVGAVILAPSLADAIQEACTTFMLTVASPGTVQSLIFILMIGAIIHLLQRSGAINRALYLLSVKRQFIKGRTQAQLLAFVAGLLMCLEGIGSMMVVGVVGAHCSSDTTYHRKSLPLSPIVPAHPLLGCCLSAVRACF
ncbi:Na+/H+ antiporter [Photobacterium aphoticum]|uniref:Na+/H+ antiporter n=1 Tax=Photobacterium aphoticum TaxID=754436 RepID=A0A090R4J1_9GAMM|nr:Na+/H+ antiporter [Photobacterium aphoticum]